jgi:uncharacterized Zn ribbon protein
MKRKELYNYIREQIVNELTETTYAGKASVEKIKKDPKFNTLDTGAKTNVIKDLTAGSDVELEEMARPANVLKKGENFTTIKNIYAGSKIENILNLIDEAGEEGISSKGIMSALGIKYPQELSPILGELTALKAISGVAKTTNVEPETPIETPEEEENFDFLDTEEEPATEPTPEKEPEEPNETELDAAAMSAAAAGADQDMMPATNKDIEVINKIRDILTKKKDKLIKADEAGDDLTFEREKAALKQYINNNKSIISKSGDLKRIISSIIDIK